MDKRIAALINKMTLEEKVSLLAGVDFWHTQAIERPGIPAIKVTDGPHGPRTADARNLNHTLPATCFPTGVALAATWNPDLIKRVGMAIGEETRARGCSILLGPCVNIHRSPLGGRNFESYSEDPYLSSRMAVAIITGIQSKGVSACVKHFALNNSEFERMTISSEADERTMREIYFPSFEKAVKEAGTWSVMCSYNKINGTYASANHWLLTEVLKEEWGFKGLVVSDWFATHSTAPAASAGLDLEMPGPALYFGKALLEAVKSGDVDVKTIDDKLRRILGVMAKTGALDGKNIVSGKIKDFPAHRKLALEVAQETIVLLKNENHTLPLKKSVRSIAVIGPNAAAASIQGGGSAEVNPYYKVSPLEALKQKCGRKIKISYELGCTNNIKTLPLNPDHLFYDKSGKKHGLKGEYFPNNEFKGKPAATRVDTDFTFTWVVPPVPGVKKDYSIRWQGFFRAPATGKYKFGLAAGGWGRVYIDGKPVCSNWGKRVKIEFFMPKEKVGYISLKSEKLYPIKLEFCKYPAIALPMGSLRIGCDIPLPPDLLERAAEAAARADVAIVFAGLTDEYESEGFDRKNMDLPAAQKRLIAKVAAANPDTIVVLNNGAPLAMSPWLDKVPAVVEALFPGQECGSAIADVLFGDVNPSGKLPDTFPRRYQDNPAFAHYPGENGKVRYKEGIFVGYRHYDAQNIAPLFPFGHGLSYTDFEYGKLKVSPARAKAGEKVNVSVDVKNTGRVAGKEVVQVYVSDVKSSLPRPPRELKAFQKVSLLPGETKTVKFTLDKEAFSFYDPTLTQWTAEPGDFEILVGSSSRDIRAKGKFALL
ncbi:MAG: glycoside hydrolase family 3 C-terminal domain-containing protein [Dehalococcoidales bacterium]|nr:glycoside hydrolase family 3 C-terminal domain-containing protein [Dehalococcoidales bacterium]